MNFKNIWEHPKTSVIGLLLAVIAIANCLLAQGVTLGKAGTGTVVTLVVAIATALLGLASRDWQSSSSSAGNSTQRVGCFALIALLLASTPGASGCKGTTVAQDIVNWTPTIVSTANTVGSVVAGLSGPDGAIVSAAIAGFDVAAETVSQQAQAYLANPNQTILQALQTQVTTFQQNVNAALLAAAKITNPESQQKVLVSIQGLAVAVNAVLALIASIKGNTVQAAAQATKLAQVEPLMDRRRTLQMVAQHYGEPVAIASVRVDMAEHELQLAGF